MREGLVDGGGDAAGVAGQALREVVEFRRVVVVVIAVEIQVEDAALARYGSGARAAGRPLVRGIYVSVTIPVTVAGLLVYGHFTVGGEDVALDEVAAEVG